MNMCWWIEYGDILDFLRWRNRNSGSFSSSHVSRSNMQNSRASFGGSARSRPFQTFWSRELHAWLSYQVHWADYCTFSLNWSSAAVEKPIIQLRTSQLTQTILIYPEMYILYIIYYILHIINVIYVYPNVHIKLSSIYIIWYIRIYF